MKRLIASIFALAASAGSALFAQSFAGAWQGTLKAASGKELRVVFKISTTDADNLKTVLYSIDQGGVPIPATSTTAQGSNLKITIVGIGGTFEGKLSGDGSAIGGMWTQGPAMPLTLKRATNETAWTIPEPPPPPKKMAADADPSFEVATIKPTKPEVQGRGFRVNGRRFTTINTSVVDLINFAYGLHPRQVIGGPPWTASDKYDLEAQPDVDGQPNDKQLKTMVQKLLVGRFQLKFHHEMKELSVYAITVAKGGSKIAKSDADPNGLPGLFFRGLGNLPARNASMKDFAGVMQTAVLDRPVVDQTGLEGRYDFTLDWTPDETQFGGLGIRVPPPTDKADAPPDLFTAIQQELGLRLESTKAMVDVLVIDHVEKPTEN